ncbi:MAG TPA: 50S ribosomal protein L6 [Blastocatellia bacterium]|jgi:large subunit ribosomal protein L6|nr:50S ribosomal protein L6 [Blastocatellia bacterium]
MSRIGKKPIALPKGVKVKIDDGTIEVSGPKGSLRTTVPEGVSFRMDGDNLVAERTSDDKAALHGLARALVNNAVVGVTDGFTRQLDIVGVGYKAELQKTRVMFSLGYSHQIEFPIPKGIEVKVERINKPITQYQTTLTITGIDRQQVGQVAADIRSLRRPDPYKGKGVRYANEQLKLKPGKTGK